MRDSTKARIAFAEALTEAMWVKGLISRAEKTAINEKNRETFEKMDNC